MWDRQEETELYALIDTCAQGGNYIHFETAQILSDTEAIAVKALDKPMKINGFNGKAAPDITHTISTPLRVGRHWQPSCTFYVTDLGRNDLILGIDWMAKHGCVPNPITRELIFVGDHCKHEGAPPIVPWPDLYLEKEECAPNPDPNPGGAQKKKRKNPLRRLRNLKKQEQKRIQNGGSIRCCLPEVVDEDEAAEYYANWEYIEELGMKDSSIPEIALIGAYATRALSNRGCSIMAVSMRDIIAQRKKQDSEPDQAAIGSLLRRSLIQSIISSILVSVSTCIGHH
jgi:hypothetical protein